jgi:hypothetical protein
VSTERIPRERRLSVELKYALISVVVIALFVVLQVSDALRGVNETVNEGVDSLARLGSIGVFVIALVANASIIIQIPYTLPLLSAALGGASTTSMLVLGIASGLGAGIGAILAYKVADTVVVKSNAQADGRVFRWINRNTDAKPRLTSFVIFLIALSPLPDGTIVMPLAMVRYGLRRLAVPLFLGKFLHNVILALVFSLFASWAADNVSEEASTSVALAVAVIFMLLVAYNAEKARAASRAQTHAAERDYGSERS